MTAPSAGILLFRRPAGRLEVLLVHPGGPFWARKDEGAWSIPKGEHDPAEDPRAAALREFEEELGSPAPSSPAGPLLDLGTVRQKAGKQVAAWAVEGDLDCASIRSNTFEMEWPPRSGRRQTFPEIDRAEWFDLGTAARKINPAQAELLERLVARLGTT